MRFIVNTLGEEYWISVYIGSDYKKLEKLLIEHFKERPDNMFLDVRGKCWWHDGYAPFIWVNTKYCGDRKKDRIEPTLAHEAIHAVNFNLELIGHEGNDEVLAHIVSSVLREYYKQKHAKR